MKTLILAALALLLAPASALADPVLTFEGELADDLGPVDGVADLTFAVYFDVAGGVPLWSETHPEVEVVAGHFEVLLGSIEPLGDVLATDVPLYLGLSVDGDAEMLPRNELHEVPRAAAALWAADVTGQEIHPAAVSIGDLLVIDADGQWVGPPIAPSGAPVGDYRERFTSIQLAPMDGTRTIGCGQRPDGTLTCWGGFIEEAYLPPPGPFGAWSILGGPSNYGFLGCALTLEGRIRCWGRNAAALQPLIPDAEYRQVSPARGDRVCWLDVNGSARCVGAAAPEPPPGAYVSIAGQCGLRANGALDCPTFSRAGPFVSLVRAPSLVVDAPAAAVVALGRDGRIQIDSNQGPGGFAGGLFVGFTALQGGGGNANLTVFGFDGAGALVANPAVPSLTARWSAGLTSLVAGRNKLCGLRPDQTAVCWGSHDTWEQPPERLQ